LKTKRYEFSIISLAFHPTGKFIAVASGSKLEIWQWNKEEDNALYNKNKEDENEINNNNNYYYYNNTQQQQHQINFKTVSHVRNIRAVIFHPNGNYLFAAAPDTPRIPSEVLTPCRYFCYYYY
jgi:WD40 repeat protein